jgi:TPR repeat protein
MYIKGLGCDVDRDAGILWLGMAASNGYGPAARRLESLNREKAGQSASGQPDAQPSAQPSAQSDAQPQTERAPQET